MSKGFFKVPLAINEPVRAYEPGSKHREEVLESYNEMFNSNIDIPFYINGKSITTDNHQLISPPHDHKHIVGKYFIAEKKTCETSN